MDVLFKTCCVRPLPYRRCFFLIEHDIQFCYQSLVKEFTYSAVFQALLRKQKQHQIAFRSKDNFRPFPKLFEACILMLRGK